MSWSSSGLHPPDSATSWEAGKLHGRRQRDNGCLLGGESWVKARDDDNDVYDDDNDDDDDDDNNDDNDDDDDDDGGVDDD